MSVSAICLVLFLAMAGHSSASYCLCIDGIGDSNLQKSIDYACGAGADCTPILQNGPCFNPNTIKDHCNYAVNSYYQRKGQASGSCDFRGTATVVKIPLLPKVHHVFIPQVLAMQEQPSKTNTPPTSATPGSATPGSTFPGSTTPGFGLAPTGAGGITNTDGSSDVILHRAPSLFYSLALAILFSGLICSRV